MSKFWKAKCHFTGCTVTNLDREKRLFRFPKDEDRSLWWVQLSGNPKLHGVPVAKLNTSYRICSDHFHDWCFMNVKDRRRLVHNAVPCTPKSSVISWQKKQTESAENVTSEASIVSVPNSSCTDLVTPESSDTDADTVRKKDENHTACVQLLLHDGQNSDLFVKTNVGNTEEEFEVDSEKSNDYVNTENNSRDCTPPTTVQLYDENASDISAKTKEMDIGCELEIDSGDNSLAESPSVTLASDPENDINVPKEMPWDEEQKHSSNTESSDTDSLYSDAPCGSVNCRKRKRKLSVEQQLLVGQQKLQRTCDNLTMYMKRICVALEETTAALKNLARNSEHCK